MLVMGSYFLFRNISLIRSDGKLESYLQTSPKGKAWVNIFGLEKTRNLSKKYFLPLGIAMASVLIIMGLVGTVNLALTLI